MLEIRANYKDLEFNRSYDIKDKEELVCALAEISEAIEEKIFELIIDINKVKAFVNKDKSKNIKEFYLNKEINNIIGKDKKEIYETYLNIKALEKFNLSGKIKTDMLNKKPKYKNANKENRIVFIANFDGWQVVKKLKLEKVKEHEVAYTLASINNTVVNKAFDLLNLKENVKKTRKSYKNLCEKLNDLSYSPKGAAKIKAIYESTGFWVHGNPFMLIKAYPDLKIPKPKGRIKK